MYDLNTYQGRFWHYFWQNNPLNLYKIYCDEEEIKKTVHLYESKTDHGLSEKEYQSAKYAYDSAFHPDSGNKINMLGRMSFQAPGNMFLTGCMITFTSSPAAAFGLQFINQTFNSNVNFSNSSADVSIITLVERNWSGGSNQKEKTLFENYLIAAGGACTLAFVLTRVTKNSAALQRFMPFVTVAVANAFNLPISRRAELVDASATHLEALKYCWGIDKDSNGGGIPLNDDKGNLVGYSPQLGRDSVQKEADLTVYGRLLMAAPPMVILPMAIGRLQRPGAFLSKKPKLALPITLGLVGSLLTVVTPAACAVWPQEQRVPVTILEEGLRRSLLERGIDYVNFNKGL